MTLKVLQLEHNSWNSTSRKFQDIGIICVTLSEFNYDVWYESLERWAIRRWEKYNVPTFLSGLTSVTDRQTDRIAERTALACNASRGKMVYQYQTYNRIANRLWRDATASDARKTKTACMWLYIKPSKIRHLYPSCNCLNAGNSKAFDRRFQAWTRGVQRNVPNLKLLQK